MVFCFVFVIALSRVKFQFHWIAGHVNISQYKRGRYISFCFNLCAFGYMSQLRKRFLLLNRSFIHSFITILIILILIDVFEPYKYKVEWKEEVYENTCHLMSLFIFLRRVLSVFYWEHRRPPLCHKHPPLHGRKHNVLLRSRRHGTLSGALPASNWQWGGNEMRLTLLFTHLVIPVREQTGRDCILRRWVSRGF